MSKSRKSSDRPKQLRKTGPERRAEIAQIAGELFATDGFQVSTRTISAAIGITQAALYKHYSSKEELIEEVFKSRFLQDSQTDFVEILSASDDSLESRISEAYIDFYSKMTSTSLRLFQRASYDGLKLAHRYSPHLDERILWPLVAQVREELSLPSLEETVVKRGERDLALMLHSTIIFLAIRRYVYHIDFKGSEPNIIRLHVKAWLAGVQDLFHSFHA